jgi:hypothetical protein
MNKEQETGIMTTWGMVHCSSMWGINAVDWSYAIKDVSPGLMELRLTAMYRDILQWDNPQQGNNLWVDIRFNGFNYCHAEGALLATPAYTVGSFIKRNYVQLFRRKRSTKCKVSGEVEWNLYGNRESTELRKKVPFDIELFH